MAGIPVNYDELLVGNYTLPDPLVLADGKRCRDAKTRYGKRRPAIVRLIEEHRFGCYMHAGGHGTIPSDRVQFPKLMQLYLRRRPRHDEK